jgi:hypothetical protein
MMLLAACAGTPTNRWAQARTTLTRTQDTILIAHEAQMIDDATLVKADPMIKSARAGLEVAEQQLPEGGTTFEHYMNIVDGILDELIIMASRGELEFE